MWWGKFSKVRANSCPTARVFPDICRGNTEFVPVAAGALGQVSGCLRGYCAGAFAPEGVPGNWLGYKDWTHFET